MCVCVFRGKGGFSIGYSLLFFSFISLYVSPSPKRWAGSLGESVWNNWDSGVQDGLGWVGFGRFMTSPGFDLSLIRIV